MNKIVYAGLLVVVFLALVGGCARQAVQTEQTAAQDQGTQQELTAENQLFDEQELEDTSDDLDELVSDLEDLPL